MDWWWKLFQGNSDIMIDSCTYIFIVSVRDITLECLQITSTIFRGSTFPGNMHNYIWCPYYLLSFMKFCSVVSEELCWQAASEVYFGKFQVQRGITPTQFRGSTFPGNMHNYIWCPYYLPSSMKFCSVVSEELHWQTVWWTGQKQYVSPQKCGGVT
jgi:hypothetical protein